MRARRSLSEGGTCSSSKKSYNLPSLYYALNVALYDALHTVTDNLFIKWPNDLVLNTKKVGGMLCEPVWTGSTLEGLVLGVGLNINNHFESSHDLSRIATSLTDETGMTYDLNALLATVNRELTRWYREWCVGEHDMIWRRWRGRHLPTGTRMRVHTVDENSLEGKLVDVLSTGTLVLATGEREMKLTIADVLNTHSS